MTPRSPVDQPEPEQEPLTDPRTRQQLLCSELVDGPQGKPLVVNLTPVSLFNSAPTALSLESSGPLYAGTLTGELFSISRSGVRKSGYIATVALRSMATVGQNGGLLIADANGDIHHWKDGSISNKIRTGLRSISALQFLNQERFLVRGEDKQATVTEVWSTAGAQLWRRIGRDLETASKVQSFKSKLWINGFGLIYLLSQEGNELARIAPIAGDRVITIAADGRFSISDGEFRDVVAVTDQNGDPIPVEQALRQFIPKLDLFETEAERIWRVFKSQYLIPSLRAIFNQPFGFLVGEAIITFLLLSLVCAPAWLASRRMVRTDGTRPLLEALAQFKLLEVPWFQPPIDLVCSNRICRSAFFRKARREINSREALTANTGPFADLGHEQAVADSLTAIESGKGLKLWFSAPGGSGKTTLAKLLAYRLTQSPENVVPVFLEHEWLQAEHPGTLDTALLNCVAGRLASNERIPPAAMVRQWLYHGQVALFIDGLSEKRAGQERGFIRVLLEQVKIRTLVITARSRPPADLGFEIVEPKKLTPDNVGQFCRAYLKPHDPILPNAEATLLSLIEKHSINPLFAKLVLTRAIAGRVPTSQFPSGIVSEYVSGICSGDLLRRDHFRFAAQIVAKTMMDWETFTPQTVRREHAVGAIDATSNATYFRSEDGTERSPSAVLDELIHSGLLIAASEDQIRFRDDPVAEYLAVAWLDLQEQRFIDERLRKIFKKEKQRAEYIRSILKELKPPPPSAAAQHA